MYSKHDLLKKKNFLYTTYLVYGYPYVGLLRVVAGNTSYRRSKGNFLVCLNKTRTFKIVATRALVAITLNKDKIS